MEGHRYADDPEPNWYAGPSQYARSTDPDMPGSRPAGPYDSGVHDRPSGAFRLPEQPPPQRSPTGQYGVPDPVTSTGSHARPGQPDTRAAYDSVRVPVRGPEHPAGRPTGAGATPYGAAGPESLVQLADSTSLMPPVAGGRARFGRPTARPAVRTRRPVSSLIVAGGMGVLLLPVVRLLWHATFSGTPSARNIVPAVLLTLGFALTGVGLFAVASGRPVGREAWLRPPVAYLPAGLILLLAAGLAVA